MKNGGYEMFDPINAFGKELEATTLLKRGFHRNFNNPFIGFWLNLAGWWATMTNETISIFKAVESFGW